MDLKQRHVYIIGIIAIFIMGTSIFTLRSPVNQFPEPCPSSAVQSCPPRVLINTNNITINNFVKDLIKLAKQIHTARKHVRGTKTGDALISAEVTMSTMLKSLKLDFGAVVERVAKKSKNVCPEVYNGTRIGYPLFDTGFVVKPCTYSKNLKELVTILIVYDSSQTFDIQELLRSIRQYHSDIFISIASTTPRVSEKSISSFKNVKLSSIFIGDSEQGMAWNKLIADVTTPYALIARGVIWFNSDARVDRLIRQIERLKLSSAGGAFRDIKGNWIKGCQQRVLRNFTLVYEAGYDESHEACVFCDHIDGPFVIKTDLIKNKTFNGHIAKQGLFEDLFLRISTTEHVVCPDAMFYTNISERSYDPRAWKTFVKLWPVQKIKFSGREILMPKPPNYPCYTGRGTALSPWCHKENADLVIASMEVCRDVGAICEIDSGTIMGSVKFHSVLPWERDADVSFLTLNFSALKGAKQTWAKMGYNAGIQNTVKCCYRDTKRPYRGYIGLRSRNWKLEMWGMAILPSEPEKMHYQPPTMLPVDVKRLRAPRNPGLWARNRYGKNIYKHAQHYSDAGDQKYRKKKFLPCAKPGNQACLDRYNPDGNLQFRDPMP